MENRYGDINFHHFKYILPDYETLHECAHVCRPWLVPEFFFYLGGGRTLPTPVAAPPPSGYTTA